MAGRPVHYFTGEQTTGCCGKTISSLGLGAVLCEDREQVTCPRMTFPEADLSEGYEALQGAVDGLKQREGDQPLPAPNGEPDIQSQVIADIVERREVGIKRYGTALQPFNGRDATRDLYEELLDGAMYAKQILVERAHLIARIAELEAEKAELLLHYRRREEG